MPIALWTHLIAATAYVILSLLLVIGWRGGRAGALLVAASVLSLIWSIGMALQYVAGWAAALTPLLEILRTGAWMVFLLELVLTSWRSQGRADGWRLAAGLGLVLAAAVAFDVWNIHKYHNFNMYTMGRAEIFMRLCLTILGIVMMENIYRNTAPNNRWSIRHMCIGIGAMLVYDLLLYSAAMLVGTPLNFMVDARGFTNAAVAPLIALSASREPNLSMEVFFSRRMAVHTVSLVASGLYLLAMSGAAYYILNFGGDWGTALKAGFGFLAILILAVVLTSGRVQSRLAVFLNKHFFSYKYDYRNEWLRFLSTISDSDTDLDLRQRTIQAVAQVADASGGALWMLQDADHYAIAATLNMRPASNGLESRTSAFIDFLRRKEWIIDLIEYHEDRTAYQDLILPEWLDDLGPMWLVVPLIHQKAFIGLIITTTPRAPRVLNWEDRDLLKTIGRQVASYLAEQESQRALLQARQFEAFNQRFAFVLHDIKNLASQLALMLKNAERHAGNPDFQRDMLLTVGESVSKMKDMLTRLHSADDGKSAGDMVDIRDLLEKLLHRNPAHTNFTFSADDGPVPVPGAAQQLETVFGHLVQNAVDAVTARHGPGGGGHVEVILSANQERVCIEVRDNGPGMTADFIRDDLFRPFRSTKTDGYGIGAYESRSIIQGLGGRLDVISKVGEGTLIRVDLPAGQGKGRA